MPTPQEAAEQIARDNPVRHPQFKQKAPTVLDAYYLVRQSGSPKEGIVFLDASGHVHSLGVSSVPENDRFCEHCSQLTSAPPFKPMTPASLFAMPMPFWFGPRVEFRAGVGLLMEAEMIDW